MPVILKPLHRQVIVLTGASSGIGLATAHLAAQRGAKLVLVARSADTLAAFERYVRSTGGDAAAGNAVRARAERTHARRRGGLTTGLPAGWPKRPRRTLVRSFGDDHGR